jgi:hypothetical protein
MSKTRIARLAENSIIQRIKDVDDGLRELKVGAQYVEARMIETTLTGAYDYTGTLLTSSAANQNVATFIVTVTSTDGKPVLATCVPQFWSPTMATSIEPNPLNGSYSLQSNPLATTSPSVMKFWFTIASKGALTGAAVYFKARVFSMNPSTVVVTRVI